MKVFNVVGTRPNFVKIAPLLGEMRKCLDLEALLVHTGQHDSREMSDCFLRELKIPPPDFRLRVDPDAHGTRKEQMRQGLSGIMQRARPDVAVVVGDVDSTVAAALAASDLGIPVAHVEAGLRSFDQSMPEEINRIVTDSVSSLFFATEPSAVRNLLAEGYPAERIFLVGNVMIDALRRFEPAARESAILGKLGLLDESNSARRYVLATLHRPGTVDCPAILARIWKTLEEIAATIPVVFPAHPRTRVRLLDSGLEVHDDRRTCGGRILMIPPQPYIDFLRLESEAALVMTDSGGVQEETTVLGVPCLTLRNSTERPITIAQGTNRLVGIEPMRILDAARQILSSRFVSGRIPALWDGRSAGRIVRVLRSHFGSVEKLPAEPPFAHGSQPAKSLANSLAASPA